MHPSLVCQAYMKDGVQLDCVLKLDKAAVGFFLCVQQPEMKLSRQLA